MIHISAYKNIIYEEVAGGSPADVTQSRLPPSNALFTLCSLWHSHSCPHRGCWATSYCNQVSGSNEDRERRSAAFPLNSPPAVPQRHTLLASVLHLCGQGWRPVAKLGHGGRETKVHLAAPPSTAVLPLLVPVDLGTSREEK